MLSDTEIIGKLTPVKSFNCASLLCGFTNIKQSGIFAVFLKHLKNMMARQNLLNLRYTALNVQSSSSFLCTTK